MDRRAGMLPDIPARLLMLMKTIVIGPGTPILEMAIAGTATDQVYDFSEELSPPVAGAVPQAAQIVIGLLAT